MLAITSWQKHIQKNFKKAGYPLFMKERYEVLPYCSSRFSDKNTNALSRLVNSFISALNTKFYLPSYVVIALEADLIDFLQYKRFAVASLLGPWVEYLAQLFVEILDERRKKLPLKARLVDKTQLYWLEAATHENFDYVDQQACEAFNHCLDATAKLHDSMRILKLRDGWDKKDDNLVINNRITKAGQTAYWKAFDASFKFNVKKHNDFVVRTKFRALKSMDQPQHIGKRQNVARSKMIVHEDFQDSKDNTNQTMKSDSEDCEDDILEFFRRHRNNRQDRFHWSSGDRRFILPRVKCRRSNFQ